MNPTPFALGVVLSLMASETAYATACLHHEPQLAVDFQNEQISDWDAYFYSEKLDGIRAYWNGTFLFTRQNKLIYAPAWFTEALPTIPMEGELWIGRGKFEQTMATVMDSKPDDKAWQNVKFMLFDLPSNLDEFERRYTQMKGIVGAVNVPHFDYVEHHPVESESALNAMLECINDEGGEGLMLRKRSGVYQAGRSQNIIKMKVTDDAEAVVIGHIEGKGKHEGRLGALLVKMPNGIEFKIGTGFTDAQREAPPALGTKVTYRHNGFTKNGIPRFARFAHVDQSKQ